MDRKLMEAKYAGRCRICGDTVEIGDWIYFYGEAARGEQVEHQECGEMIDKNDEEK